MIQQPAIVLLTLYWDFGGPGNDDNGSDLGASQGSTFTALYHAFPEEEESHAIRHESITHTMWVAKPDHHHVMFVGS